MIDIDEELDHPSDLLDMLLDVPRDADFEGDPYPDENDDEPEPVDPHAHVLKQFDLQWTEEDVCKYLASLPPVPDGMDPETGWFPDYTG